MTQRFFSCSLLFALVSLLISLIGFPFLNYAPILFRELLSANWIKPDRLYEEWTSKLSRLAEHRDINERHCLRESLSFADFRFALSKYRPFPVLAFTSIEFVISSCHAWLLSDVKVVGENVTRKDAESKLSQHEEMTSCLSLAPSNLGLLSSHRPHDLQNYCCKRSYQLKHFAISERYLVKRNSIG